MGPVLEEWGVLGLYTVHGPFVFAGADSLMPSHQMRPIMTALWGLGYMVDPNSWWFWHLELAALLLVKGASMSAIAVYLTNSRRWAVIAGLLLIVWPADTLQMAFRASPITLSVAATVASAALMVAALTTVATGRRIAFAILGSFCLLLGAWSYELALAFWPLPFLLLWAREGLKETIHKTRRGWQAVVIWGAMAAICAGYIVWTLLSTKVLYQTWLASQGQGMAAMLVNHLPALLTVGALRALVTSWAEAVRIVVQDFDSHWYFLLVSAVICSFLAISQRAMVSRATLWKMTLLGFCCVLVGYAPYILLHYNTSDRTFMFAAFGATLVFLALLVALDKASPAAATGLAVVLLTFGTGQQIWQFREYASLYDRQRAILGAIVEQVPAVPVGKSLVILDESQQLLDTYMLADLVPSALTYIYGKSAYGVPVQVCFPQSGLWAVRDAALRQGTCEKTAEGDWFFRPASPAPLNPGEPKLADILIPRDEAVVVRIGPDGKGAIKPALLVQDAVASARYHGLLQPDTWPLRIFDRPPGASYRWDFGRRWTMQDVLRGSGWGSTHWDYKLWRSVSGIWMNKSRSQLVFELGEPARVEYLLTAKLLDVDENARRSLKATVNGVEAPLQWITPLRFRALVPKTALKKGGNLLEFQTAPTEHPQGLSLHFDWIDMSPDADALGLHLSATFRVFARGKQLSETYGVLSPAESGLAY